jgi:heavy metal sensor kinase
MLDTMRARLTFWYTGVLALVIVIFAVATYAYLARAARLRTDQSLADTANSLISNFSSESNDEDQSSDDAAIEVTRDFQFNDRQALIFDTSGHILAVSNTPTKTRSKAAWPTPQVLSQNLSGVLEESTHSGRVYAILPDGRAGIRALATMVKSHGQGYIIVVVQSLHDQAEALEEARDAFYVAVPLAVLIASLGGFFLARKSLRPVAAMGEMAARISAANLGERLPVSNERSELGHLARIFNELLARLDLSFEQQRRFMADASHELRTPVAIVCGESEVALSQQTRSPEEYRESLSIMHDEGRRLTRIVEDLFMLARADAGQYRAENTSFYLDETVAECVRAVRSLASRHELEIRYQQDGEELLFRGDEGLVRRMIMNVLDNAIKYTGTRGEVYVKIAQLDSIYKIRIRDTGGGIPVEDQPHIFERFYRVDKARSRSGERSGAGLGLSIAAWVAEMHRGSIALAASNEQGSTFVVSLPVPDKSLTNQSES